MQHCQLGSPNPVVGSIGPAGSHWNIPTRRVPPRERGVVEGPGFGFPPPVHAAANRMATVLGPEVTRRPGYRQALTEAAVVSNAALAAYTLQQELGTVDTQGLQTSYGVYLLAARQIWAPRSHSAECDGLAYPPSDFAAFSHFADAVVRSDRIAALLEGCSA